MDVAEFDNPDSFRLVFVEQVEEQILVAQVKGVTRLLKFVLVENIAVSDAVRPLHVVNIFDALNVHGEPFKSVSYLHGNGLDILATDLLKIRELSYLHAVEPNFPAETPRA